MVHSRKYTITTIVKAGFDELKARVVDELAKEGFNVLTEIDVQATLQKRLGVDFRRYVILGACNPPMAHRAMTEEPDLGVLLPCNVVLYEGDDGTCTVSGLDPIKQFSLVQNPKVEPVALEVFTRLNRVLENVRDAFGPRP